MQNLILDVLFLVCSLYGDIFRETLASFLSTMELLLNL